jgi:hypothetical protein
VIQIPSFLLFCNAILGPSCSLGYSVYNQIHDSIKATTKSNKVTLNLTPKARECESLRTACRNTLDPKLSQRIDKNAIIANYDKNCQKAGCPGQVTTVKKGEPTKLPTTYPTIYELVRDCSMKPSLNHQYMVSDVVLDNVIIKLLKHSKSFLTNEDVANLSKINGMYQEMVNDVTRLRTLDFSQLREPRIGYADQTAIQQSRVNMATACAIHYTLHPGMVIRYAKGEYVGENRDVAQILHDVSPHVNETDAVHIDCILTQG